MNRVELQIQFQNIDPQFTQKSQVATRALFPHEVANVVPVFMATPHPLELALERTFVRKEPVVYDARKQ